MDQNYSSIQERTNLLNKDADKKSIMDSIDRPIRPLIIELNRMGLVTTFSCCGYTYDGQEEPKTHEQKAYVLFRVPLDNKAVDNFFRLSSIVSNFCWGLNVCSNGTEWCIMNHVPEIWKKSDNLPETIHDYEMRLIGITKLTKALKNCPSISEEYTIRDGNETRRDSYGEEWMIVPKKPLTLKTDKIYTERKNNGHITRSRKSLA